MLSWLHVTDCLMFLNDLGDQSTKKEMWRISGLKSELNDLMVIPGALMATKTVLLA